MPECVHHWRQEPNNLRDPFICLRCGAVREFETNYFELMDRRENSYSFRRGNGGERQNDTHGAVTTAHGNAGNAGRFAPDPKVLVVDDEAVTALMVKQLLEDYMPCKVETALNGRQALEKAEKLHPDLTLLDIRMPDMDGLEVCQRIKGNPSIAPSAIVYFSAYPKPEEAMEGADGYLTKPLEPSTLLSTVKSLVAHGAA